ncbi:MAG: hypothetical protein R6X10_05700 [Desulfobacterales bacterium]
MDQKKIIKQALDFNKNVFNNVFNALVVMQDHAERACNTALENANWIPKEGKNTLGEWVASCKKGRETYKDAVNDGFQQLESVLGATNKA